MRDRETDRQRGKDEEGSSVGPLLIALFPVFFSGFLFLFSFFLSGTESSAGFERGLGCYSLLSFLLLFITEGGATTIPPLPRKQREDNDGITIQPLQEERNEKERNEKEPEEWSKKI
jgi:hypothetical protein